MALNSGEIGQTADWIESVQLRNGMIPWFPGGHADPWNHIEAVMALVVAGRRDAADRGLGWLASSQQPDGAWYRYYLEEEIEDTRRDTNVCAYVATGAWWYYLVTRDFEVLARTWPVIDAAMAFVLSLQQPGGEILWSIEPDGSPGRFALLTGSSSIHHSLRCALAAAAVLGHERPHWELAAGRIAYAVSHREDAFEPKDRWAMDWYYPVLCGAVSGAEGRARLLERWPVFLLPGVGVRCVSDQPWVTAAETAECVMALDACGLAAQASMLLEWIGHFREADGSYWTGCVHPQCVRYPGGERSTYTAAAVLLADHVLNARDAAAGLFRGESLPEVLLLPEIEESIAEGG